MSKLHAYPVLSEQASSESSTTSLRVSTLLSMAILPAVALAIISLVCILTPVDLALSNCFYQAEAPTFPYRGTPLANLIFHYGPLPGIVFGVGCIIAFIASFNHQILRTWRMPAFFIAVAIIIGPGILVNSVLKPTMQRSRPSDLVVFGGNDLHVPPLTIGSNETGRSFPSGHAAMGFVFMLPGFVLLRKYPRFAALVFAAGFFLGAGIGLSRIAEGRHFLSDIAWSGAIVYFTGLTLYVSLNLWRTSENSSTAATDSVSDQSPEKQKTLDHSRAA